MPLPGPSRRVPKYFTQPYQGGPTAQMTNFTPTPFGPPGLGRLNQFGPIGPFQALGLWPPPRR
jgi:hypothetical protein